jgi:hypothetical protein
LNPSHGGVNVSGVIVIVHCELDLSEIRECGYTYPRPPFSRIQENLRKGAADAADLLLSEIEVVREPVHKAESVIPVGLVSSENRVGNRARIVE